MTDEPFISRWSRRKTASKAGAAGPTADAVPVAAGSQSAVSIATDAVPTQPRPAEAPPPEPLPPIESLTRESDFAPFMKADVDPALKRNAFKKLIEDPQFNVMDGLDVYIDDYSKPDPLPEGWLEKMNQVRHLGIFKEEAEEAEEVEGTSGKEAGNEARNGAGATRIAMDSRPVSFPPSPAPADTSSEEILPADVGKEQGMKGGS